MEKRADIPSIPESLRERGADPEDWAFCWRRLEEVSRTFSEPIRMLPPGLRAATTCGYLLCRVADTVEDHPTLPFATKREVFQRFTAAVESDESVEPFLEAFADVPGEGPYYELSNGLDRVMAVYRRLPDEVREPMSHRVGEMARGMLTYERRRDWQSGLATVSTLRDLERYCYFVAGTVGHLLTDVFLHEIDDISAERRRTMRGCSEEFGLGLQMVNILKDQTDDREEGWCYIPTLELERRGLDTDSYLREEVRDEARRALEPIFDRTEEHLGAALDYTLAIPAHRRAIRTACLLPLWLAVRTVDHARGNDAMFEPGAPVKISRDEVAELVADCTEHADDDAYLRRRYDELWDA